MYWFMVLLRQVLSQRTRVLLFVSALLLAMSLIVPTTLFRFETAQAESESYTALGEPPASAEQVVVGFYPINVYNLDIANNTYFVDAYAWFRWKGEINPTETVEFVNAVDEWSLIKNYIDETPVKLSDGSFYQSLRIEGRFAQPFNLTDFPLDQQNLALIVEDTTYTSDQLVYMPDTVDTGYGKQLTIPGWNIMGWEQSSMLHQYGSKFGEIDSNLSSTYAALRYQINIQRPVSFFIWKLLLPLLIVVGAHWCTFLLHPSLIDVRTAVPSTAMLTLVFLQQSYTSGLPDVGYLVLLDRIYVVAYLLTIVTLTEGILTGIWAQSKAEADYQRVKRLDRRILLLESVLFILSISWILFSR